MPMAAGPSLVASCLTVSTSSIFHTGAQTSCACPLPIVPWPFGYFWFYTIDDMLESRFLVSGMLTLTLWVSDFSSTPCRRAEIDSILEETDQDGNGLINRQEFGDLILSLLRVGAVEQQT